MSARCHRASELGGARRVVLGVDPGRAGRGGVGLGSRPEGPGRGRIGRVGPGREVGRGTRFRAPHLVGAGCPGRFSGSGGCDGSIRCGSRNHGDPEPPVGAPPRPSLGASAPECSGRSRPGHRCEDPDEDDQVAHHDHHRAEDRLSSDLAHRNLRSNDHACSLAACAAFASRIRPGGIGCDPWSAGVDGPAVEFAPRIRSGVQLWLRCATTLRRPAHPAIRSGAPGSSGNQPGGENGETAGRSNDR